MLHALDSKLYLILSWVMVSSLFLKTVSCQQTTSSPGCNCDKVINDTLLENPKFTGWGQCFFKALSKAGKVGKAACANKCQKQIKETCKKIKGYCDETREKALDCKKYTGRQCVACVDIIVKNESREECLSGIYGVCLAKPGKCENNGECPSGCVCNDDGCVRHNDFTKKCY
jgi:hypothetical protein